jgi:hypothetical protein
MEDKGDGWQGDSDFFLRRICGAEELSLWNYNKVCAAVA